MSRRLDRELVARGLARSRTHAQALIADRRVLVDGVVALRPAELVVEQSLIEAERDQYVSRAAYKLLGALDDLAIPVPPRALDAGASTGGFTQVLLERGCQEVVAVDVGTGQLAPEVRADPRVQVWERTNLRDLRLDLHLAGRWVDLTVADVSFISLTLLVEPLAAVTRHEGTRLLMVKPQFEVGRERLGRGGVVQAPELHHEAVSAVVAAAAALGCYAQAAAPSRLPGPAGNREFFVRFQTRRPLVPLDLGALVGLD